MSNTIIRPATQSDAADLAALIGIATYGFINHVFADSAPQGVATPDFIRERIESEDSALSYCHSWIAECDGQVAGFINLENILLAPPEIAPDTPDTFRALLELEYMAPGTTLINFVATYDVFRGQGIGAALMAFGQTKAGPNGMSLTVIDTNSHAINLYQSFGYEIIAKRPIVKGGWDCAGTDWVLMVKP